MNNRPRPHRPRRPVTQAGTAPEHQEPQRTTNREAMAAVYASAVAQREIEDAELSTALEEIGLADWERELLNPHIYITAPTEH